MNLSNRISAFALLGNEIKTFSADELKRLSAAAAGENPWFTPENVTLALQGVASFLTAEALTAWTLSYHFKNEGPKKIGVAMAGNIPLVGFHDALCVLISGNQLKAKLSSHDSVLMNDLMIRLIRIEAGFEHYIAFVSRLNGVDAVIATGGNNTARYFEYYFRAVPHILRKNRSSCAVISGDETSADLELLGSDVFSYYGLGCRSVSKLYVPLSYDFSPMLFCWEKFKAIILHHKFVNNYDYQRSILLINKIPFYDNGNILLKEDPGLVSPLAVLFFEYYNGVAELTQKIRSHEEQIQCVVSADGWFKDSIPFGRAQFPSVTDYADGIDTLEFISALS